MRAFNEPPLPFVFECGKRGVLRSPLKQGPQNLRNPTSAPAVGFANLLFWGCFSWPSETFECISTQTVSRYWRNRMLSAKMCSRVALAPRKRRTEGETIICHCWRHRVITATRSAASRNLTIRMRVQTTLCARPRKKADTRESSNKHLFT